MALVRNKLNEASKAMIQPFNTRMAGWEAGTDKNFVVKFNLF